MSSTIHYPIGNTFGEFWMSPLWKCENWKHISIHLQRFAFQMIEMIYDRMVLYFIPIGVYLLLMHNACDNYTSLDSPDQTFLIFMPAISRTEIEIQYIEYVAFKWLWIRCKFTKHGIGTWHSRLNHICNLSNNSLVGLSFGRFFIVYDYSVWHVVCVCVYLCLIELLNEMK